MSWFKRRYEEPVVMAVAKSIAVAMRYEPHLYNKIIMADNLSDLADALGLDGDTTFATSVDHLKERYKSG